MISDLTTCKEKSAVLYANSFVKKEDISFIYIFLSISLPMTTYTYIPVSWPLLHF